MSKNTGMAGTVLAVIVSLAVAGTGGYMIGARSAETEAVMVAKVNDKIITKDAVYEKLAKQYGADLVSQMIDEEIVNQIAEKAGVKVTAAEVDAEIAQIKERIGGQEKFDAALAQYGLSAEQLKQDQTFRLKITKILSKDIPTDDAALKKYFEANLSQFDTREVKSRHILMQTEEEAKAIKAELDKGADFAALAKEKSTDPTAKENGGDLGFNKRGNMVPAFDDVVFKLKKGETSAPFQSEFGWHVAQVTDTKGETSTFESAKAKVKEAYLVTQVQEKIRPWLDEQKTKAKVVNTLEKK